jgi:acetoacetyl-CoA synthetase
MEHVTWRRLRERIRRVRDALESSGIQDGDVVAAVMSNSVDTIVICLATLSLGAIWSSSSPDLGSDAIVDRFGQVSPKIVFADDGYIYAGKRINLADRISKWSHLVGGFSNGLRNVVVVPYCNMASNSSDIYRGCTWESFLGRGRERGLSFSLVPFSHPAFILYSSGTVSCRHSIL